MYSLENIYSGAKVDELFSGKTEKITFVASFADDTRTSYQGEGKVDWEEGDSILYYTKKGGSIEEYEVVRSGHSTNVVADVTSGTSYIIAAYGGTGITDNTVTSFTLNGAVKAEQTGKFEDAHVSVAKGFDIEDGASLAFHNMTSLIKFTLERTDVSYITFTANGGEKIHGNGKINISFTDNVPSAVFGEDGGSSIRVNTNGAGTFYIATLPVEMSSGFTITFYNDNGTVGRTEYSKSVSICSNEITNLGMLDSHIEATIIPDGAVDMGLNVLWASCNVGATTPEGYGDFYAWGEIEPYYEDGYAKAKTAVWRSEKKSGYSWKSYTWCKGSETSILKYNSMSKYGDVDNNNILLLEDDVASVRLGEKWHMPTRDDWNELVNPDNCSWVWKVKGGAYGYKVTSKITGNSIFLPATGYRIGTSYEGSGTNCLYWSSSLAEDCPTDAWRRSFSSGNMNESINSRYTGLSVRPVYGDVHVSEMLLSEKISIIVHNIVNLSVKIVPANATNYEILWSSNDTNVVTVDNTGKILANNAGTAVITVATTDGRFKDSCIVTVVDYSIPVDLGLSVKWASCNLGANAPEEYGDYYTWGDIETYYEDRCAQENPQKHWKSGKSEGYTKENYKFFKTEWREIGGVRYGYTKYAPKFNGWGFGEFYDNKTALDLEDDVAQIKLGGKWRMPTNAEFEELLDNCTSEWMTLNGVIGRKFISKKNGNSIFLPAAGFRYEVIFYVAQPLGRYWSSSLWTNNSNLACYLGFDSSGVDTCSNVRSEGLSVRPVSD